jgi:hypothetical protein
MSDPTRDVSALLPWLSPLPGVSLNEVIDLAALQTRVDRKYLVTMPELTAVLRELAGTAAALDIDGRRMFGYSSVYFDTDDLRCFRDHRQGRRRRFKVRIRTYVDSGDCVLEVKSVGPRGQTVKHRMDYPPAATGHLTGSGRDFVARALDGSPVVGRLRPVLTTDYRRATLLDRRAGSRLTIDVGLRFAGPHATPAAPARTIVVETKSPGHPGRADMELGRLGVRPVSVSKYCIGIALLHPTIPANPWHRVLRRHFDARIELGPVIG